MGDDEHARANKTALGLLARREHTRREMLQKLTRRDFDADVAGHVVDALVQRGLLCEQRFAASFVSARAGRGQGPRRLRAELAQRGLDDATIETALAEAQVDWHALARRVREKKFGASAPADFTERARQTRFLEYRGFEPQAIGAALSAATED